MINLVPIIERIKVLLIEDTEQSVTYAALEARLALEKVCYDRLRQRHDYISHKQLQRWQPAAVVKMLIKEVDEYAAETMTFFIGKNPGVEPEHDEFLEIGTQIGLDHRRIAAMWNALSNLALHVGLPEHKDAHMPDYGNKLAIHSKVNEVLEELERLSKETASFSGFGEEVSFTCVCGEMNHRRAGLLRDGQDIRCINPDCNETWKAIKADDGFWFERKLITVNCEQCQTENHIPSQPILDMRNQQIGWFFCCSCQHKNFVQWRLKLVRPRDEK